MKKVDWSALRDDGVLVLLTAEEVSDGLEMKMADFRDTHALYYQPLRAWIGMSRAGVELGTGDPQLSEGIWLIRRDDGLCAAHENMLPDVSRIALRRIS